ncbi:MAG: signal recognition particle protein [Actinobacteria bacterium]|nr:MAG: signal recognition particle protein [Actinomycetota bacterium]
MFDTLSDRIQSIFSRLKGRGRLSEADVDAVMREVRLALLEADVNFKVVKQFIGRVRERCVGGEVLESLTPGQQVVKIVNEELTSLMGGSQSKLVFAPKPPTVIMMVGLQGSGKTTASAKLAYMLKKQGRRPFLIAADIYRPAAIDQLEALGADMDVQVWRLESNDVVEIARTGVARANESASDVAIVDTAGRLHIDDEMMDELVRLRANVKPTQILLVVDAMTGQDAVNVATSFQERLDFDGVVLTKLDGDARGGAALSVKAVTGKPIKLASVGEKLDSLEPFHPDRMASRILGMGDVLTLIEKAEESMDAKRAAELEQKLRAAQFTFDDFLEQIQQVRKMGPIGQVLGMIPGMDKLAAKNLALDDKDMERVEAIIRSMTPAERANPQTIGGSRRARIAAGSGTSIGQVNQLLKQFAATRKMMKQFGKMGKRGMPKGLPLKFG